MSRIQCFLLEPTDRMRIGLRRYTPSSETTRRCPSGHGYHDATTFLGTAPVREAADGTCDVDELLVAWPDHNDPRWPEVCEHCGAAFALDDEWQHWTDRLYRRVDTGEEMTLREAPAGAIWRATWYENVPSYCGSDGRAYVVRTPGGDWHIDGRASNCTRKDDDVHRCWVRHGEAPLFTVDKNGDTCAAGAGSILCGSYHGFLRAGYLEGC